MLARKLEEAASLKVNNSQTTARLLEAEEAYAALQNELKTVGHSIAATRGKVARERSVLADWEEKAATAAELVAQSEAKLAKLERTLRKLPK